MENQFSKQKIPFKLGKNIKHFLLGSTRLAKLTELFIFFFIFQRKLNHPKTVQSFSVLNSSGSNYKPTKYEAKLIAL